MRWQPRNVALALSNLPQFVRGKDNLQQELLQHGSSSSVTQAHRY